LFRVPEIGLMKNKILRMFFEMDFNSARYIAI